MMEKNLYIRNCKKKLIHASFKSKCPTLYDFFGGHFKHLLLCCSVFKDVIKVELMADIGFSADIIFPVFSQDLWDSQVQGISTGFKFWVIFRSGFDSTQCANLRHVDENELATQSLPRDELLRKIPPHRAFHHVRNCCKKNKIGRLLQ